MDLVLWRHADAEDGADDAARALTAKGMKQAARMAAWLDSRLPGSARVIASPAVRAQQTAQTLSRETTTSKAVNTAATAHDVLKAAGWPAGSGTVVVVGHQPTLGRAVALALTGKPSEWPLKKGAVWWIRAKDGEAAPTVIAVMTPELL
jgi:phosphohistidine phosphatase